MWFYSGQRTKLGCPNPLLVCTLLGSCCEGRICVRITAMLNYVENNALQQILEMAPTAIAALDTEHRVVFWNAAAQQTFGWSAGEMFGKRYSLGYPALQPSLEHALSQLQQGHSVKQLETLHAASSGHSVPISLWATPVLASDKSICGSLLMLIDTTGTAEAERRVTLSHGISTALASSSNIDHSAVAVLQELCCSLRFDFASFWRTDIPGQHLRCVAVWQQPYLDSTQLQDVSLGLIFNRNQGIAGRTLEAARLLAIDHCLRSDDPRTPLLDELGLGHGFSVPINLNSETAGVIELLAYDPPERDAESCINRSATQIAEHLERNRNESLLRDSERLFRTMFHHAGTGIAITDVRGRILASNPAVQQMLGYSEQELASMRFTQITHPDDLSEEMELFGRLISGSQTEYSIEKRYIRKDGSSLWARLIVTLVLEEPVFVIGMVENINATREVLHALRESEARYRLLVEGSEHVFFYQHDIDGRFVYVSPSVRSVLGFDAVELLGTQFRTLSAHQEAFREVVLDTEGALKDFQPRPTYTAEYLHKDGRVIVLEVNESPIQAPDGRVLMHGFARDVTANKRNEQQLRLSRDILQNVETLIVVANGRGEITYVNPAACRLLGYPPEELLGLGWWYITRLDPTSALEACERVARCARGDHPIREEPTLECILDRFGRPHWIDWRDNKGPGDLLIGAGQDISLSKAAEDALEKSELELRAIFENALDGMLLLDDDGTYIDVNPVACAILATPREQIIGRRIGSIGKSELGAIWRALLATGTKEGECVLEFADGTTREIDYSGKTRILPGLHLILIRDITERKRLEAQLRQSQKMEAVGRLAGGVAHDFNNMLMVIRGYSELLQQRTAGDVVLSRYANSIINAADRAALITQQLLAFSRRQVIQPQVVSLNTVVEEMARLLHRIIGEDIALQLRLAPDLVTVKADPGQLGQIVLNLVVNARDAMPSGGTLEISTMNATRAVADSDAEVPVASGTFAVLSVTDSGCGMDQESQAHIFEPFFTTKPQGKGTGLGLATVYGIVRQSGGWIEVISEIGKGSTFNAYFPEFQRNSSGPPSSPIACSTTN